jgi:hypothetical protein
MPIFHVMLSTPGEPKSESLQYESDVQPQEGSAIFVDGRWAGIREAIPTQGGGVLLDCRRFYRFAMVDESGEPVGDYFHEEPTMQVGARFMPDEEEGRVVRVQAFEDNPEHGFDGLIVVEPFED